MKKIETKHKAVLEEEVKKFLAVAKKGLYIDTTVGGGGHSQSILTLGGNLLGLDQDPKALLMASKHLASACPPSVYHLAHSNFANLKNIAQKFGFVPADGILFDLGISSLQLEEKERGFSFLRDEPLDMRMDPQAQGVTAADLINALPKRRLYELFNQVDEKLAWSIAQAIVLKRKVAPIKTTGQLSQIIERVYKKGRVYSKVHPATKVFLALRIAVNSELEILKKGLTSAFEILKKEGRLVVISFHSGEDRIVKNFFRLLEKEGKAEILTQKPAVATEEELRKNPRARSAKLRVLVKK